MIKTTKPEGSRNFFRVYRSKNKEIRTIKEYRRILNLFILYLKERIFDGDFVVLPYRLGYFAIVGDKPKVEIDEKTGLLKGMKISWGMTKKLGKTFRCTNERTDGYRMLFKWVKSKYIKNRTPFDCFRFYLSTPNRRELYYRIIEGKEYYYKN